MFQRQLNSTVWTIEICRRTSQKNVEPRLKCKHLAMLKILCSQLAIEIIRRVYGKHLLTIHANNLRTFRMEVIYFQSY